MKKGTIFTTLFRILGIVVFILGIRMVGEGIYNYIEEHRQEDWDSATAYVADISSKYSSSRHHRSVTYEITYQYEAKGKEYSGKLYNRSRAMGLGDEIKIKYDPKDPGHSTDILSPSWKNLVVFLVFGGIFLIIGFFLSGIWALIRKIRRKGRPQEEEILPPEEYGEPEEGNPRAKRPGMVLAGRIGIAAVFLGGIFFAMRLFPGTRSVGTERFAEAAEEAGYRAVDTTEELRQSWKTGSMLKEAASFYDDNIRMDFVVMDTAGSAGALYNGMTLPIADGEAEEYGKGSYERYSVEDGGLYAAKIRVSGTVVYVSAQADYKAEVVELLEKIGYWEE